MSESGADTAGAPLDGDGVVSEHTETPESIAEEIVHEIRLGTWRTTSATFSRSASTRRASSCRPKRWTTLQRKSNGTRRLSHRVWSRAKAYVLRLQWTRMASAIRSLATSTRKATGAVPVSSTTESLYTRPQAGHSV